MEEWTLGWDQPPIAAYLFFFFFSKPPRVDASHALPSLPKPNVHSPTKPKCSATKPNPLVNGLSYSPEFHLPNTNKQINQSLPTLPRSAPTRGALSNSSCCYLGHIALFSLYSTPLAPLFGALDAIIILAG